MQICVEINRRERKMDVTNSTIELYKQHCAIFKLKQESKKLEKEIWGTSYGSSW